MHITLFTVIILFTMSVIDNRHITVYAWLVYREYDYRILPIWNCKFTFSVCCNYNTVISMYLGAHLRLWTDIRNKSIFSYANGPKYAHTHKYTYTVGVQSRIDIVDKLQVNYRCVLHVTNGNISTNAQIRST